MYMYGIGRERKNDATHSIEDSLKEMMLIIGRD